MNQKSVLSSLTFAPPPLPSPHSPTERTAASLNFRPAYYRIQDPSTYNEDFAIIVTAAVTERARQRLRSSCLSALAVRHRRAPAGKPPRLSSSHDSKSSPRCVYLCQLLPLSARLVHRTIPPRSCNEANVPLFFPRFELLHASIYTVHIPTSTPRPFAIAQHTHGRSVAT